LGALGSGHSLLFVFSLHRRASRRQLYVNDQGNTGGAAEFDSKAIAVEVTGWFKAFNCQLCALGFLFGVWSDHSTPLNFFHFPFDG
jgi:hypothetical protein